MDVPCLLSLDSDEKVRQFARCMDVGNMRKDYRAAELHRNDLSPNPFEQFKKWFDEALNCSEIREANAMTLATAGKDGQATARTVLLKAWDERGFVFYTNYTSPKAQQIAENPQVALLFLWLPLERQISLCGRAEKIPPAENLAYFASRPVANRLGAWASPQSSIVSSRSLLEENFEEMKRKFSNSEVPMPDFWGGFRVMPQTIEFWQGRANRLHDRFLYTNKASGGWQIDRLAP